MKRGRYFFPWQWFSWDAQIGCWKSAHIEFSKLFKCDGAIGAGSHGGFKLPQSSTVIGDTDSDDAIRDKLFYNVPYAEQPSVALCLVGEARQSTFHPFDGRPPVSRLLH